MANVRTPNGVPCFDNGTYGIRCSLPRPAKVCVLSWEEGGDWATDGRKGSEFLAGWSYCFPRYSDPVVQRTSSALHRTSLLRQPQPRRDFWRMEFKSATQLHWLWNIMNYEWLFYYVIIDCYIVIISYVVQACFALILRPCLHWGLCGLSSEMLATWSTGKVWKRASLTHHITTYGLLCPTCSS